MNSVKLNYAASYLVNHKGLSLILFNLSEIGRAYRIHGKNKYIQNVG
jgi:hypothetical protein